MNNRNTIRILNNELGKAEEALEKARRNGDYVGMRAWFEYQKLVESLIKRLQDEG